LNYRGVTDKARVRKLLQGSANLEFWETYDNKEIYPLLEQANTRLKEILTPQDSSKTIDTAAVATATTAAVNPDSAKNGDS
jgi:SecD/SecF fusion protein